MILKSVVLGPYGRPIDPFIEVSSDGGDFSSLILAQKNTDTNDVISITQDEFTELIHLAKLIGWET